MGSDREEVGEHVIGDGKIGGLVVVVLAANV